jgi:hypothetical protein
MRRVDCGRIAAFELLLEVWMRALTVVCDVQSLGSSDESPGRNDLTEKFARVHCPFRASIKHVLKWQVNSFVQCMDR